MGLPAFEGVLSSHGIEFEERGNRLTLRCPFHSDTKPSAAIYFDSEKFHCWVCELTLGISDFTDKLEGKDSSDRGFNPTNTVNAFDKKLDLARKRVWQRVKEELRKVDHNSTDSQFYAAVSVALRCMNSELVLSKFSGRDDVSSERGSLILRMQKVFSEAMNGDRVNVENTAENRKYKVKDIGSGKSDETVFVVGSHVDSGSNGFKKVSEGELEGGKGKVKVLEGELANSRDGGIVLEGELANEWEDGMEDWQY